MARAGPRVPAMGLQQRPKLDTQTYEMEKVGKLRCFAPRARGRANPPAGGPHTHGQPGWATTPAALRAAREPG